MNPVYVHFGDLSKVGNPSDYVSKTLNSLFSYYQKEGGTQSRRSDSNIQAAAQQIVNAKNSPPPITNPDNFPSISDFEMSRVKRFVDCAIGIINEVSPLYEGETDAAYSHSYLSEDWSHFQKGCGIISRTTNYGTTYFLFPNTLIGEQGALNQDLHKPIGSANPKAMAESASTSILDKEPFNSIIY